MGTQGSEQDVSNVDAVEKDAALADVVQARDEIGERGLAAARASDEAHRLARLDDEVEVAQHPLVRFRVLETDAAELDAAATRVQAPRLRTVGDLGARVEDLVQALRRGAALLAHRQHPSDGVHRPDEHENVAHERHKPADREPALDDVDTPQKKHRDERQVGQEVQLGPDLGAGFDTPEAGLSDHARLAFETLLEQRHPTERLDDAYAGCHLLDGRGQVAGEVLDAPRDDLVLVVKDVAEDRDRQHADHDHERELPVQLNHQDQHDDERHHRLQEPHQAKPHEPAHGADIGDGAGEKLPGVPVVVEGDLQILQMRVEIVAQVGLHAIGRDAGEMTARNDQEELQHRDQDEHPAGLDKRAEPVVGDRAVDDVLDHLRNRRRGGQAAQLREPVDQNESGVRPQVRHVAPQRQQAQ